MNVNVGDILQARYELGIVFASFVVAVLGSYAALYHAQHMFRKDGSIHVPMAIGGAVALGGVGIWTMHFIGMIGYRLPVPVVFEGGLTLLSLVAAIVIAGIALVLAGGRGKFSWPGWAMGSLLAAAGVCVMHYMGMYAMELRATMALDTTVVLMSIGIAVVAASAALWLAFHVKATSHRLLAALVMGLAVCAMHYTGMASAQFICIAPKALPAWYVGGSNLSVMVFGVVGFVLVMLLWNMLGIIGANDKKAAVQQRSHPTTRQTRTTA